MHVSHRDLENQTKNLAKGEKEKHIFSASHKNKGIHKDVAWEC